MSAVTALDAHDVIKGAEHAENCPQKLRARSDPCGKVWRRAQGHSASETPRWPSMPMCRRGLLTPWAVSKHFARSSRLPPVVASGHRHR
eukprot:15024602-Alexandrium_andersonii.AAC.1